MTSVYDWPEVDGGPEAEDEVAERHRFFDRRHAELDLKGALAAARITRPRGSRRARDRARRAGLLFAPPVGTHNVWLPLGPMTVVQGQAEGRPRVSGRVRALAVEPDGERVYAAAANGGIWYSADAGSSWRSIGGFAATDANDVERPAHRHACGAILVRFDQGGDESLDEVFVGTGEITPTIGARPGGKYGGVGILVATGPAASADPDPWTIEWDELTGDGVYRLAAEPAPGTRMVAATSIGLFERPAAPGPGVDWERVAGDPFESLEAVCTDVLWTVGDGVRPARLWVWIQTGDDAGLWVRAEGETDFAKLSTPGAYERRSVLAAADPPDRLFLFNDRHSKDASKAKPPALYLIDATGAGEPTVEEIEDGVPPDMLCRQGFYDMAVAVDPTNPDRVLLGGAAYPVTMPAGMDACEAGGDAAIFSAEVGLKSGKLTYGHPTPAAMVGVGAHADVHDLQFAEAGARLFMACDGGVFRSDHPHERAGFVACNDDLAVIEADYVASHSTCEGHVVVGLQDNGIIERASTGVWRHAGFGDGGGVAFDPVETTRYVRQYHNSDWTSNRGGGFHDLLSPRSGMTRRRRKRHDKRAKDEDEKAAFYSTPATVKHARPTGDVSQALIGTDRPWYTEDWGVTWVTLPTGDDPITPQRGAPSWDPPRYDRTQDQLPEGITVCRWASPDVAWILCEGLVMRLVRAEGSADARGPGTWTPQVVLRKSAKGKKDATSAEGPIRESPVWTDLAINPEPDPNLAPSKEPVYMGTVGNRDNDEVDTLWWFDGSETWYPTGLRSEGVPAPVTAVLCDPVLPEHVYVGTTVGVLRGTRTLAAGQPPDWVWEKLVNGLPEAVVQDLSLFEPDGLRLLRAAIESRGIWELELDADVQELTYVRAHEDDLRRRPRALETKRDGVTERTWHGSPDVRPRLEPAVVAKPALLPWTMGRIRSYPDEVLRRFQAALRSQKADARCRPTGRWDRYFDEVLRSHGAPLDAGDVAIDDAFWDSVMVEPHVLAEPWGAGPPREADLHDLSAPLSEGDLAGTSCTLPPARLKIDVVVHHRGLAPVDGADVRVTLLHWIDPKRTKTAKYDDSATWFAGDVPWTAAVNDVLNSSNGRTSQTFGQGWAFTRTTLDKRLTLAGQALDPAHSGIATFDIDLVGAKPNLVVLLVAVIRAGDDVALTPATLGDLVLDNPCVAVRSMRVSATP